MLKHHVQVDGHNIYVVESSLGGPSTPSSSNATATSASVVLVPGHGDVTSAWNAVQRLLPPSIRSFTYDRLGLGQSDATDLPRPATILAQELKSTLKACDVPPPYLLVGHSYAGIICREFLAKYDEDVVGLVYVDANQENTVRERDWPEEAWGKVVSGRDVEFDWNEIVGLKEGHRCTKEEWEQIGISDGKKKVKDDEGHTRAYGEAMEYKSSVQALGRHGQLDRRALGDRPLSVIVANLARDLRRALEAGKQAGLGTPEDHAVVEDFCERLPEIELRLAHEVLKLSSLHRLILTSVSGHMVPLWEPELCVQEILWCLEQIKRRSIKA
ncbi:hypothetical protein IAR55_006727 [Kwoniella newhampshirensis]|uniref:AB hydrolase-1 domain-containing protein n=1 Tax=Kwoniella newhampshirensis TaxID=1651941 RepID=A0AAW0YGC7_9TREE